jgi:hypothetical protein
MTPIVTGYQKSLLFCFVDVKRFFLIAAGPELFLMGFSRDYNSIISPNIDFGEKMCCFAPILRLQVELRIFV